MDLSGLKDVHAPIEPSLFPLAWGWWVVIFIVLGILVVAYWTFTKMLSSPERYALQQLKKTDRYVDRDFLIAVNELLKRSAIHLYGAKKVAHLYGKAWISFLNKHTDKPFGPEYLGLLEKNMYASMQNLTPAQRKDIRSKTSYWLSRNL